VVSKLRWVNQELEQCNNQNNILVKINNSKDRVITELQEAGKILQDQLRLVDDKMHGAKIEVYAMGFCRFPDALHHLHTILPGLIPP
jgi:hypothetical protein